MPAEPEPNDSSQDFPNSPGSNVPDSEGRSEALVPKPYEKFGRRSTARPQKPQRLATHPRL